MAAFGALRVDCRPPGMETIEVEEYDPTLSCNSGSTTPSEDIWTKFEMEDSESLYPTPPLSPENKMGSGERGDWYLPDFDQFRAGKMEPDDQLWSWIQGEQSVDLTPLLKLDYELRKSTNDQPEIELSKPVNGLKQSLIQDCMWSAYKKLLQKDTEKVEKAPVKEPEDPTYNECNQPSDCVDPTAVFPYPLSIAETRLDLDIAGTTTPSDSEEEIDVVTIATIDDRREKQKAVKREPTNREHFVVHHQYKPKRSAEPLFTSPEHDYAKPRTQHQDYRLKRSKCTSNIAPFVQKKRKLSSSAVNAEEVARRLQDWAPKSRNVVTGHLVSGRPASTRPYNSRPYTSRCSSKAGSKGSSVTSSRSASDTEDSDKRVSHNVLERKRREDLRTAFFQLRDRIPPLTTKERVSKVVILEEARNYVLQLRESHTRLSVEREQLSKRRKELTSRLRKLKAAMCY